MRPLRDSLPLAAAHRDGYTGNDVSSRQRRIFVSGVSVSQVPDAPTCDRGAGDFALTVMRPIDSCAQWQRPLGGIAPTVPINGNCNASN